MLEKLCGPAPIDLCLHLPSGIIDRRYQPTIQDAEDNRIATFEIVVEKHNAPPRKFRRAPYKILCSHETGYLTLIYFNAKVKELIYLGDHIRTRVEVCGNDQFIVKVPNSYKGANLKEGATVKLSWKASDSRALDLG